MIRSFNPSRALAAAFAAVCLLGNARALDPNRTMEQYVREQWTNESTFPGGPVYTITQTPDGYLWIGTHQGLVKFDGFDFRQISTSWSNPTFQNDPILGLTTDDRGKLLVLFWSSGVLWYEHGKLESVPPSLERAAVQVTATWREKDGTVLLSDGVNGIFRFRGENVEVLFPPTILPGSSLIISMSETADGKIWLGTIAEGLFYVAGGQAIQISAGLAGKKINSLLPVGDKELLVGTDRGLFRWNGSAFSRVKVPPPAAEAQVLKLLRDHDGNVWVGTTKGLLRMNANGISSSDEGYFGNSGITALFEDREGNLWAGGARGVERIRDGTFVTYSSSGGGPPNEDGPVYVDSESRTWFASAHGGLYLLHAGREQDGRAEEIKSSLLQSDVVYSIAGHKDEIWVGTQHSGLVRLGYRNGIVSARNYTQADGLAENSVYAVYLAQDGTMWAGTLIGGVSELKDGRFTTYTTTSGLASNTVSSIRETPDGTLWFGTSNGLSSLSNGHWTTYTDRDGLPSNNVHCLLEHSSGGLWVGTSAGLAFVKSGQVHAPRRIPDSLREAIFGLAEDNKGRLWIATSNRVLRVQGDKLFGELLSPGDVREYGVADGLLSTRGVARDSSVVSDSAGKIWFALGRGLSVVDPSHIADNSVSAIAHVEAILADNDLVTVPDTADSVRVPPSPKRITFDYVGLSLRSPERIRFRYFLDGFDRTWSEPLPARQAVYTNLGPGSYRFRVIASNSDGIWNGAETSIVLKVEPALWQTWWFSVLCVSLGLVCVWIMFQVRVRQIAAGMNARFDERMSERNRVATELHDTILQTVQATKMIADNARYGHSADPVRLRDAIDNISDWLAEATTEARAALNNLRTSTTRRNGLVEAFQQAAQTSGVTSSMRFVLSVEGAAQDLHPIVRDETYRIGTEAIRNAYLHSEATELEMTVSYAHNLTLRLRDNGRGIDPKFAKSGKPGHFGLQGMQERAIRIHGTLLVRSRPNSGTEVELVIPGEIAFQDQHYGQRSWYARLRDLSIDSIFSYERPDQEVEQSKSND